MTKPTDLYCIGPSQLIGWPRDSWTLTSLAPLGWLEPIIKLAILDFDKGCVNFWPYNDLFPLPATGFPLSVFVYKSSVLCDSRFITTSVAIQLANQQEPIDLRSPNQQLSDWRGAYAHDRTSRSEHGLRPKLAWQRAAWRYTHFDD